MTSGAKRYAILFLIFTVITMVLIAATLPKLIIEPAIPLPVQAETFAVPTKNTPEVDISIGTFSKTILIVIVALVLPFIAYRFIKGVPWKETLGPTLLIVAVTSIVLSVLFAMTRVHITLMPQEVEILPPAIKSEGPPIGPPPVSLVWMVWIGIAVVIVILGMLIRNWRTRLPPAGDTLTLEAERAMRALHTGLDLKNVIVNCYRQMSRALQREQGIELSETMTAREFEGLLDDMGFPPAPVHQLTQLFEIARYGVRPLNENDERDAFDCLNAIVQHSREERQPR